MAGVCQLRPVAQQAVPCGQEDQGGVPYRDAERVQYAVVQHAEPDGGQLEYLDQLGDLCPTEWM